MSIIISSTMTRGYTCLSGYTEEEKKEHRRQQKLASQRRARKKEGRKQQITPRLNYTEAEREAGLKSNKKDLVEKIKRKMKAEGQGMTAENFNAQVRALANPIQLVEVEPN